MSEMNVPKLRFRGSLRELKFTLLKEIISSNIYYYL